MKDIIVIAVLLVIILLAVFYIYRSKKKGKKCIGCPYADSCGGGCANSSDRQLQ